MTGSYEGGKVKNISKVFSIIAKYNGDLLPRVELDHLYVVLNENRLTAEDKEVINNLGWKIKEYECGEVIIGYDFWEGDSYE
ncbi:MAG: hypothetical protein ACQEQI_00020 [Bacillota bacterium]